MADATERLNRIDESYVRQVDEILNDTDKVPVKVQVGLILAMQSQILRGVNGIMDRVDIANGRTAKNEAAIMELKKKNAILWMENNPRMAIALGILTVLFLDFVVDAMDSANSMTVIVAFLRKWLGI